MSSQLISRLITSLHPGFLKADLGFGLNPDCWQSLSRYSTASAGQMLKPTTDALGLKLTGCKSLLTQNVP